MLSYHYYFKIKVFLFKCGLKIKVGIKNVIIVFIFGQIIDTFTILKVIFIFNFFVEYYLNYSGYFDYNYFNFNLIDLNMKILNLK